LIEKLLEQFETTFSQRNIEIVKHISSIPPVKANETLMETLFGNLISNALRYTPENGTVEVDLAAGTFKIGNSSCGKALDKEKLFKRFQKQGGSGKSGSGLGLAICKRICDLYGYGIHYDFSDAKHWFIIDF
jgi:signal transduction histidine kinase